MCEQVQKEVVSPFQVMLYAYRAVVAVGVGIFNYMIFPFCTLYYWQSTYVFDLYPQSLISCESL